MRHTQCIITGERIEIEDCKLEFDKIELAWCAGFFDGEGSTSCSYAKRDPNVPRINLNVTQLDLEPLRRFKKAIGFGTIYNSKGNYISQILLAKFELIQMCMILLWPYLTGSKKDQYKKAVHKYMEGRKKLKYTRYEY